MQKAQQKFSEVKNGFLEMFEQWKNSGKITIDKFNTLTERLNKTSLEAPRTKDQIISSHNGVATCSCHILEGHREDQKECKRNTINLRPELILALDHEGGAKIAHDGSFS